MKLNSLSLFVGTGKCNANCGHCGGISHRKYAPKEDGVVDECLIYQTLKNCYKNGARSLSISSSGEPTLSPKSITRVMDIVNNCKREEIIYSPINLYSNGIRIGQDKEFCEKYLPTWKNNGLTTIYVTVHSINKAENAKIYGIKNYPSLEIVLSRIHNADLMMRANLILSQITINTYDKFVSTVDYLKGLGIDKISCWSIRDTEDKLDSKLAPSEKELDKMESWIEKNKTLGYEIRLLREKDQLKYTTGQKLTLFPNGKLSSNWCN